MEPKTDMNSNKKIVPEDEQCFKSLLTQKLQSIDCIDQRLKSVEQSNQSYQQKIKQYSDNNLELSNAIINIKQQINVMSVNEAKQTQKIIENEKILRKKIQQLKEQAYQNRLKEQAAIRKQIMQKILLHQKQKQKQRQVHQNKFKQEINKRIANLLINFQKDEIQIKKSFKSEIQLLQKSNLTKYATKINWFNVVLTLIVVFIFSGVVFQYYEDTIQIYVQDFFHTPIQKTVGIKMKELSTSLSYEIKNFMNLQIQTLKKQNSVQLKNNNEEQLMKYFLKTQLNDKFQNFTESLNSQIEKIIVTQIKRLINEGKIELYRKKQVFSESHFNNQVQLNGFNHQRFIQFLNDTFLTKECFQRQIKDNLQKFENKFRLEITKITTEDIQKQLNPTIQKLNIEISYQLNKILQNKLLTQIGIQKIQSLHDLYTEKHLNITNKYLLQIFKGDKTQVEQKYIANKDLQKFSYRSIEQIQRQFKIQLSPQGYSLNLYNITFNMQTFGRKNWKNLEYLCLTHCEINDEKWKLLVQSDTFKNLKWLEIQQNNITTVREGDLDKFKYLQRVNFHFNDEATNPLSEESKRVLERFKQTHPNIAVIYSSSCRQKYRKIHGEDFCR